MARSVEPCGEDGALPPISMAGCGCGIWPEATDTSTALPMSTRTRVASADRLAVVDPEGVRGGGSGAPDAHARGHAAPGDPAARGRPVAEVSDLGAQVVSGDYESASRAYFGLTGTLTSGGWRSTWSSLGSASPTPGSAAVRAGEGFVVLAFPPPGIGAFSETWKTFPGAWWNRTARRRCAWPWPACSTKLPSAF